VCPAQIRTEGIFLPRVLRGRANRGRQSGCISTSIRGGNSGNFQLIQHFRARMAPNQFAAGLIRFRSACGRDKETVPWEKNGAPRRPVGPPGYSLHGRGLIGPRRIHLAHQVRCCLSYIDTQTPAKSRAPPRKGPDLNRFFQAFAPPQSERLFAGQGFARGCAATLSAPRRSPRQGTECQNRSTMARVLVDENTRASDRGSSGQSVAAQGR